MSEAVVQGGGLHGASGEAYGLPGGGGSRLAGEVLVLDRLQGLRAACRAGGLARASR